jgi:hypothetical protein
VAELDILITRFDQLDKRMDERFQALNTRIDDVVSRLSTIEARLLGMETRLDAKASHWLVGGGIAWLTTFIAAAVGVLLKYK